MGLIWNEKVMKKFVDIVIPELDETEVLVAILVARKKYADISRSQEGVAHQIIKRKEDFVRKIRRFTRIDEGDYIDYKTGEEIPLNAFACYVDLTPKDMHKACKKIEDQISNWNYDCSRRPDKFDRSTFKTITRIVNSRIHKSNSDRKIRSVILDVDCADTELELPLEPDWITITHGGMHIIYTNVLINGKEDNILKEFASKYDYIEYLARNVMTPIPGTIQGGFRTYGYTPDEALIDSSKINTKMYRDFINFLRYNNIEIDGDIKDFLRTYMFFIPDFMKLILDARKVYPDRAMSISMYENKWDPFDDDYAIQLRIEPGDNALDDINKLRRLDEMRISMDNYDKLCKIFMVHIG